MASSISTIDKIIIASIQLYHKNSYSDTTLQQISKASKVSIGSIYHAFPNGKSDILGLIAQRYFEDYKLGINKLFGKDLISTSLEAVIDGILDLLIGLGNKYPCSYDPAFETTHKGFMENIAELENQFMSQVVLMVQIKIPTLTRTQAELKVKICYQVWESLLCEYEKTNDPETLIQLKILTLKYLQD
jgi:AcrR family transcriptional regulator